MRAADGTRRTETHEGAECGARLAGEHRRSALLPACAAVREHGGRLVALWGTDDQDRNAGFALHVAFAVESELLWLTVSLPATEPGIPDLATVFPYANRMQRAVFDLVGIRHEGDDQRPWPRHAAWPRTRFPCATTFPSSSPATSASTTIPSCR